MNIKTRRMKDSGRAAPARSSGRWLRAALKPIERMCTTRTNAQLGLTLGYDSLPFFLTPLAILALAGLLDLAAPTAVALLFAGAFAAGYVAYGLSHWAIHNIRFRNTLVRRWAADHHIHHYHTDKNFGVTTPLWDMLLRTRYVSTRKSPKQSEITVRPNDRP